jgi:hypothetical protein
MCRSIGGSAPASLARGGGGVVVVVVVVASRTAKRSKLQ